MATRPIGIGDAKMKKKVDEFAIETKSAVAKINNEANKTVNSWLQIGKIISEYIEATDKSTGDAFKRLANDPECHLGASSCRSYYSAYELRLEIGKTDIPPEATYTAFSLVATVGGLNYGNRKHLLVEAEKHGWKISQLKEEIKRLRYNHKPSLEATGIESNAVLIEWKDAESKINVQTKRLLDSVSKICGLKSQGANFGLSHETTNRICELIKLLREQDMISNEVIQGVTSNEVLAV